MSVESTSYEKLRVILILCRTGKGKKLPPYVILNRKTIPKENFCKDIIVRASKNAWMTSELMEDWLGRVWERRPGALSKPRSMLAMGAFRSHLSDRMRNRLRKKNTDIVIIPSGITSQLQPLDVSINRPFKHLVRKHYVAWLNKDNHILTPTTKIKRASASVVLHDNARPDTAALTRALLEQAGSCLTTLLTALISRLATITVHLPEELAGIPALQQ
jgi:hypothetical protein